MKAVQLALFLTFSTLMTVASAATVKMKIPSIEGSVQSSNLRLISIEPYIGCTLHDGAEIVNGKRQKALNAQLAWQNPSSIQFRTEGDEVELTKWFTSGGACYAGVLVVAVDNQNKTHERELHVVATTRMDAQELQNFVDSQEWQDEVRLAFQRISVILAHGWIVIDN